MNYKTTLLLLALACNGKDDVDSTDDTTAVDPTGDTDVDTVDDTDVPDDTDETDVPDDTDDTDVPDDTDDTDLPVAATSCAFLDAATDITTREPQTLVVEGDVAGVLTDVTTQVVSWSSSDEAIASFWADAILQPVTEGTVTITAALPGDVTCTTDVNVTVAEVAVGDLVLNELLADVDGDPNQDGTSNGVDDEFVEIANVGNATVDLSGVTIIEADFPALPRHTFADGTVLRAGEAIVVFAGGDTSNLSSATATFEVAVNADPAFSFGLNLNDAGDHVTLRGADGATVLAELAYGDADATGAVPAPLGVSITRDPDLTGAWVEHPIVVHTPGTFVDGSEFAGFDQVYQDLYAP